MKDKLPVGEWKIGDDSHFISFALTKKPKWFHRMCAKFFFGLVWVDYEVPKPIEEIKPSKGLKIGITKVVEPNRRMKGRHRGGN